MPAGEPIEEAFAGGFGNAGMVVRVGDTVRRPTSAASAAVSALLLHLEAVGFEGAPRYLGADEHGRDVLTYVAGEAPQAPFPAWSMTDHALTEMARLLRRYHDAVASFDATGLSGWSTEWSDPLGGPLICHNDVFPENVVFRDRRPVAIIDFDMAGPGRPMWDLAITTQEWCPLAAPEARRNHPPSLDGIARLGMLARAYGIAPAAAPGLVQVVLDERAHALANIRQHVARGQPVWTKFWHETDGEARAAVDDAWIAEHHDQLIDAIASG